jgi:hypothetical protein
MGEVSSLCMRIVTKNRLYYFVVCLINILQSVGFGSMRLSLAVSSVLLLQFSVFTLAHNNDKGAPVPGIFGGRAAMRHLSQHTIEELEGHIAPHIYKRDWTKPDVDSKKRCGPGVGYCNPGDWYGKQSQQLTMKANWFHSCSPVGFCGRGYQHCTSPNCQTDYSNGCDASIRPLGEPTLNVSRPLIGNVTYEADGITHCKKQGAIALTFDDGPFNFTSHLLDVLASYGAKATFFITGNNLGKGQIDIEETGWPALIRRMHTDGHQVLSFPLRRRLLANTSRR